MNTYKVHILAAGKFSIYDSIESPNIKVARKQVSVSRSGKKDIRQEVSRIYKNSK